MSVEKVNAEEPAEALQAPPAKAERSEREHFFGAAKLVALLTLLSRFAGLARDLVQAWMYGAGNVTDCFNVAFAVPNMFRRLFGEGALSAAFVPVFSEINELHGRQKAAALFANVMGLAAVGLCVLCLLIEVALVVAQYMTADDCRLTLWYTSLMLPFMVTICLLAIGSAALNCVGHFAYPAAAPILLNFGIIAANLWIAPHMTGRENQLAVVALSVVGAGILQLVGLIWLLKAHRLPFVPKLWPLAPEVRTVFSKMLPMLLPLGIFQFMALVDKTVALFLTAALDHPTFSLLGWTLHRPLVVGAVTELVNAERLYQFPLGVMVTALGTAIFPLFSRYAARGDMENLRYSVNRALRTALFEGLPSSVGMLLLAGPLTSMLYAHGFFSKANAGEVAHVLRFYSLGIWAFCAQQILLRAFYAQKDTTTPLRVACSLLGVNFLLNITLVWVPSIRQGAFGLSTSITGVLNVLILVIILRRRLGRFGLRKLAFSVARIALATGVMALVVWQTGLWMTKWHLGRDLYVVAASVPAGALAFFVTCLLLRAPELKELLAKEKA